jgi:hypothetical protein
MEAVGPRLSAWDHYRAGASAAVAGSYVEAAAHGVLGLLAYQLQQGE